MHQPNMHKQTCPPRKVLCGTAQSKGHCEWKRFSALQHITLCIWIWRAWGLCCCPTARTFRVWSPQSQETWTRSSHQHPCQCPWHICLAKAGSLCVYALIEFRPRGSVDKWVWQFIHLCVYDCCLLDSVASDQYTEPWTIGLHVESIICWRFPRCSCSPGPQRWPLLHFPGSYDAWDCWEVLKPC